MNKANSSWSFQGDIMTNELDFHNEEKNDRFEFILGAVTMNPRRKPKYVNKPARTPTKRLMKYNTGHYVTYDPGNPIIGSSAGRFRRGNRDFNKYDNYSLVDDSTITLQELPKSSVRLSDYWAATVAGAGFSKKDPAKYWPAEFDHDAMIKAERFPLGNAAKIWVDTGSSDVDGNTVPQGQEGWYYLWYRGIHILMGEEGLDLYPYLIRTSFDAEKCEGVHSRVGFPAAVQSA